MLSIEVNGNNYTFCWGTLAFRRTCDKLNCSLQELDLGIMTNDAKYFNELAYSALVVHDETFNNGANASNGNLKTLSFAQFCFWLDNADVSVGKDISQSYLDSKYLGKTMQEHYDELLARISAESEEENKDVKKKTEQSVK